MDNTNNINSPMRLRMERRMSALFPEISANSFCLLKPAAPTFSTHPYLLSRQHTGEDR